MFQLRCSVCPIRHPFTPAKLCTSLDEAKLHAAEHTLQILGVQTEGADASAAAAVAAAFPGMWGL